MGREFVIGDIHGAHIPLKQCLERCGFDKENDLLITLGDICDGWKYVYECIEELLTIRNRIDIIGNHDDWFIKWLDTGIHPDYWRQGGRGTAISYMRGLNKRKEYIEEPLVNGFIALSPNEIPESHRQFFEQQHLYYKDDKDRLFVHGGFDRHVTLQEAKEYNPAAFYWDRELWYSALSTKGGRIKFTEPFTEIFIGHTATTNWSTTEPMHADIIWNLDTGAGSNAKLTIMDINTHEYWQSDCVKEIYGKYKPR